jgi:hypothetical protein
LVKGDDDAFDFLRDEAITVEVLGPIPVTVNGVAGLRFLGTPVEGLPASIDDEARETRFTGLSASHTINGHSIVLRLKYGRFRFLFAGDLNAEAELDLTRAHLAQDLDLTAEVLKAPHHGSADFSWRFLRAVSPVISVVSAGDENARKEYIHPRATLIGALGKQARPGIEEPLIFVTEMVAFFATEGWIDPEDHEVVDGVAVVRDGQAVLLPARKRKRTFFAFSRPAFGIVKIRTDGERLLVFTNSGQIDLKEAYAYQMNDHNQPERVIVRRA